MSRNRDNSEWVDLCKKALTNMQTSSAGPTRSGKQIQVRVSFPWKGKWTTGYMTISRSAVMSMKDASAVSFKGLVSCPLRLQTAMMKSGMDRWIADTAFEEVWGELEEDGFKEKTLHIRKEIARLAREAVRMADSKRDEVRIAQCKEQIPVWLGIALHHGITADELHVMVDEALVKDVLKD